MNLPKGEDLAWLAGILEGEGSFQWMKRQPGRCAPYIQLRMSDKDVVERAAILMNTLKVRSYQRQQAGKTIYKRMYVAVVTGFKAALLMEILLPQMGVRRAAKIRELLLQWKEYKSGNYELRVARFMDRTLAASAKETAKGPESATTGR